MKLSFRALKNETVVVMRGDRVAGTIRRYRGHGGCIVSVIGILSPAKNPGQCFFKTIPEAKRALRAKDQ